MSITPPPPEISLGSKRSNLKLIAVASALTLCIAFSGSAAAATMDPKSTLPDARPIQLAANDEAATAKADASSKGDPVAGKETFNGTCSHCHGPNADVGDMRLNLRRLKHKYTDQMEPVFFTTVTAGRPAKGMPAWKDVFTHQDFVNILAYLNTVQEP